jgi:uncharacterized membrane protein
MAARGAQCRPYKWCYRPYPYRVHGGAVWPASFIGVVVPAAVVAAVVLVVVIVAVAVLLRRGSHCSTHGQQ